MDLNGYRAEAEEFVSAIDREYYLHFSGQKDDFEIEPIYERHAGLFSPRIGRGGCARAATPCCSSSPSRG